LETATPTGADVGVQRPIHYGPDKGYIEDPEFVPNPTDEIGYPQTSIEGGFHSLTSSPIHEEVRRRDLTTALRALDPHDPTSPDLVVVPNDYRTADDAKRELVARAAAVGVDVSAHSIPLSDGTTAAPPT
jgi:hypothetical protein